MIKDKSEIKEPIANKNKNEIETNNSNSGLFAALLKTGLTALDRITATIANTPAFNNTVKMLPAVKSDAKIVSAIIAAMSSTNSRPIIILPCRELISLFSTNNVTTIIVELKATTSPI